MLSDYRSVAPLRRNARYTVVVPQCISSAICLTVTVRESYRRRTSATSLSDSFTDSDSPTFLASVVAKKLGHRDAEHMLRNLDDDEKGTHIVGTLGGPQEMAVITVAS